MSNNPLKNILESAEFEVRKIDHVLSSVVEDYLREFFNFREYIDRNYETVTSLKLKDGAIILKWHLYSGKGRNAGKKGGPYWYLCVFQETGFYAGKFIYKYIGSEITKNRLRTVYQNEKAEVAKWKFIRNIASWDRIEYYNNRVKGLKANKKKLTGEVKRLKALIRNGRTELSKKKQKKKDKAFNITHTC